MAGVLPLSGLQIGVEGTKGSAVTTTREMYPDPTGYFDPGLGLSFHEGAQRGTFSNITHATLLTNTPTVGYRTESSHGITFDELSIIGSQLLGGATGAGGGADKTWTFTPSQTAPSFDAYTLNVFDASQAYEVAYCFATGFTLSGGFDDLTQASIDFVGRQASKVTVDVVAANNAVKIPSALWTIKYAAAPLRFPDMASSPNGMQSDLSSQNVTLKQGAMFTLKLRDVNSAALLRLANYSLLAENFSCFAMANPWVQGGYYVAASSISGRPIEADGTVRIGPVLPGVYYDVKCEQSNWDVGYMRQGAQNYSPAVVSGIRPSAGETRDLGVLDLRQGQALRGIVKGRDGLPLTNIKVTAKPSYVENPTTVQAMTNGDGLYTLWVSTYVSRYFDITAAPREQNQTVDVSTIVYRQSVYTAVDISRSSATVDFTLDTLLGGVAGGVNTIDGGALSYPFGEMQGFPAAALFIQPYGTVPRNNPIGDIEAITAADGTFSVPLATGAYTLRIVSLGYSVPSVTFTVTGSGMVNLGNTSLVKGGTVTGQIRKPDSTATGGYTEPNSDEINLVAAANDGFTEFVMGTVVSDSVSRTITRYAISGFKPDIDYSLALMSNNGDMTFPSEGGVRFKRELTFYEFTCDQADDAVAMTRTGCRYTVDFTLAEAALVDRMAPIDEMAAAIRQVCLEMTAAPETAPLPARE